MRKLYVFVLSLLLFMGQAAMAQTSSIAATVQVNRTSGVAPLMVFFDASGTTDPGFTARPFHDLNYQWNFGDTSATNWSRGSRAGASSKNSASGPISAHVFEYPGTYLVTLKVSDGITSAIRQISITVADPNAVFTGTKTVCFSTGARGFSGCPAGAQQVTTSNFASAINTYRGTGKRLLFRRGETFASSTPASINVTGPGIIGAFGPVTDPLPTLQSNANMMMIQLSSYTTPNISDWRVMDLNLVGSAMNQSAGVALVGGINQVTFLRLSFQRHRMSVFAESLALDSLNKNYSTAGHKIWDQVGVVDCTITNVNHGYVTQDKGYGTYLAGDRIFYAGNYVDAAGTSASDVAHVARFPYLGKAVISNNTLMRPGPGDHTVKIHAPAWTSTGTTHYGLGGGYTRWLLISDNKIVGASNPWIMALGPQNAQSDERVKDVISERNWITHGPAGQVAQVFFASEVTSRNNIIDSSGSTAGQMGTYIARRGIEPAPNGVRVYNDTYYTSRALSSGLYSAIYIAAGSNIVAKNNVGYAPNASNPRMFNNTCGACLTQSNNSTDTLVKFNLPFTVLAPSGPAQFKVANYAVGNGAAVPVWTDFFALPRSTTQRNMGSVAP